MVARWIILSSLLTILVAGHRLLAIPQRGGDAPKPRLSQHGAVSQTVNDTVLTIEYNRPVARGRKLFGALVPWGRIWCPGADEATALTLTTDIVVNGKKLPAGSYSVWANPNPDEWTIIFSRAYPTFHTPYPAGQDALRVAAKPRSGEHRETLSFYFPVVDGKRAELVLHWGTVVVPLELEVP
ncbi:MAG: hypothetical protein A3H94_06875 [Acidobacteria bacterium RIFCSPLOWO2_02_FULL_60_20]|nr:MAG: hypothetical protein A3H94_06875 [Acidobacteria bacterium RIFCSPLOWO2_02_FULL_60_20]